MSPLGKSSCFFLLLSIYFHLFHPSYRSFHLGGSRWCDFRRKYCFPFARCDRRSCVREKLLVLLTFCLSLRSFLQQPAHMKCSSGQVFSDQTLMTSVSLTEKHVFGVLALPSRSCWWSDPVILFLCNNKMQAQYDNDMFICCRWKPDFICWLCVLL